MSQVGLFTSFGPETDTPLLRREYNHLRRYLETSEFAPLDGEIYPRMAKRLESLEWGHHVVVENVVKARNLEEHLQYRLREVNRRIHRIEAREGKRQPPLGPTALERPIKLHPYIKWVSQT